MEQSKVDQWLMVNASKLPATSIPLVREKLLNYGNESMLMVISTQMKDPTTALILSLLLGCLGIDRFYIGDTGLGVGKLLTWGGCYIWAVIDWFMIMEAARTKNLELLMRI